jgi:hypothetical protein
MSNFAVIKNNQVVNLIVADTKEIAEQVTKLLCVQYTDVNSTGIGWEYDGTGFIGAKPFDSWVFNYQTYQWEAPLSKPVSGGPYYWNETNFAWEVIPTE